MRLLPLAVLAFLAACDPMAAPGPDVPMSDAAAMEMARVNATDDVATPVKADPPTVSEDSTGETPAPHFDAGLVRVQVLLDRAHFSPGVIDGFDGENVRKAIRAYQQAQGLDVTGEPDDALLARLERADGDPALVSYVIRAEDVAGPFVQVPRGFLAMSRLRHLGYGSAAEALAERFHMDEDLLRDLNPGVDFTRAGAEIVVAGVSDGLAAQVAVIEIDKEELALRAYDAGGQLLAYYPVTIGSEENPPPSGEHSVRAIAFDPTYNYDPERLQSMRNAAPHALTIAAGPNNPVGSVWIALSIQSYGIHGTPEPSLISKTSSHGCVRLTNWDARELAGAVSEGVPVRFLEARQARREADRG